MVRVKVNVGEQREFRLASCSENHSRCCHLSAGALLLRTGSQLVGSCAPSCTSDGPHGVIQLYVDEISMCRILPNWSTARCHRIAEGQG